MITATIRDLRTRFPSIRRMLEQDGEVVITDRGRPVMVLRAYEEKGRRTSTRVDYYGRLRARMAVPLTAAQRRALDEVDRGERS